MTGIIINLVDKVVPIIAESNLIMDNCNYNKFLGTISRCLITMVYSVVGTNNRKIIRNSVEQTFHHIHCRTRTVSLFLFVQCISVATGKGNFSVFVPSSYEL